MDVVDVDADCQNNGIDFENKLKFEKKKTLKYSLMYAMKREQPKKMEISEKISS